MKVGVVGAGSWGTALAKLAAERGHEVAIWAFEPEVVDQIRNTSFNSVYLPEVSLPPLAVTGDLAEIVAGRDLLLSVMPSHVVREIWSVAGSQIEGEPVIVSATKGIENVTLATMVEVLRETLPRRLHDRLAVLSGPSFAAEVARKLPTAVVVAAQRQQVAEEVQRALSTDRFRVYTSIDVPGVEIGGAVKNVVAIAAGIVDGLRLGHNTRAALITRGLAEITRLAMAKAANPLTLAGLAGLGDLVLTCTGELSRNRDVGFKLGQGSPLEEILASTKMVAEGIRSAKSCRNLALRLGVEMPITEAVHAVIHEGLAPMDGVVQLMGRQLKQELERQD
jgi:glycerol-3-phosphate dehydrogenase (NAD(P)+)